MRETLEPLRILPFRRLLASYLINETGDVVGMVALALLVYDRTGDALATAGLFLALNFAPAFIAPLLTARLDAIPVRRALPLLYAAEAAVFLALAALAHGFALPAVLALGFVDGTIAVTARGLTRAAVGVVLEPGDQLRKGNALLNVCFAVAGVGGAALGGVLTGAFGPAVALLVDACSFALVGATLAMTRSLPAPAPVHEGPGPLRERLRAGLSYVGRTRMVRVLVAGQALAFVCFTLVVPIEVVYAREALGASDVGFGILLSSWSGGMVVGSLLFVAARQWPLARVVVLATGAIGVAYLGMAAVSVLWAACAFSVLGGIGNGMQWVSVVTAVQQETPRALQARVMGVLESLARAAPAVGFVAGGVLTALFSAPVAFAVAGSAVCALALAAALAAKTLFNPGEPVGR